MCNEKPKKKYEQDIKDYRFIIYRLDQLENEEKENFKQLMQMLQSVQEGLNEQNKTIVELTQRQSTLEEKITTINQLVVSDAKHTTELNNIYHRLNIYKAVLIGITITVGASILATFFK